MIFLSRVKELSLLFILNLIKKILRLIGYDLIRSNSSLMLRLKLHELIKKHNIDIVFDVGANRGQFSEEMRSKVGYKKNIVSFEPLSTAFNDLENKAKKDKRWHAINIALGNERGELNINVAANSVSSSFLKMLPLHEHAAPESIFIGNETAKVERLDEIAGGYLKDKSSIFIKIDAQGYEKKILDGGLKTIEKGRVVLVEMSLSPLYEGEVLFQELRIYLEKMGYVLVLMAPGFSDPKTGQILQIDGVFERAKTM